MSIADDIENAPLSLNLEGEGSILPSGGIGIRTGLKILPAHADPGSNPGKATPEVAAILKAADMADEPQDLRVRGPITERALEMPLYVYRNHTRKLTQVVMDEICNAIRGGAMDYVAAEASGISQKRFDKLMEDYSIFRNNVNQAHAQCRVQLEQDVAKKKPLEWLLKGPGREKPGKPGWAAQTALTGADGGEIKSTVKHTVDLTRLPEAELEKLRELLSKAEAPQLEGSKDVLEGDFKEVDSENE